MRDRPRPLLEHLRELKSRLMRVGIVGLVFTIAAIIFYEPIFKVLERPAGDALNPTLGGKLAQLDVTETWSTIARVGIIIGMSATLPYFLFELIGFIRPALKPSERRWVYILVPAGLVSFALGVAFGYFVLLPPAIRFLLTFGSDIAEPVVRISTYVNLIIALMFWMGVVFEIPMVMFFLGRVGVLKGKWVAKQRKWALLLAFVLGAIITPTADPVNQALVAGPIIVMYEIGHWLVRITEWMRARKRSREARAGA